MPENYFEEMVSRIARLATMPAWKAWAKQWAKELEADQSGAYTGLVEAVRSHLKSCAEAPKSGGSEP